MAENGFQQLCLRAIFQAAVLSENMPSVRGSPFPTPQPDDSGAGTQPPPPPGVEYVIRNAISNRLNTSSFRIHNRIRRRAAGRVQAFNNIVKESATH